MNALFQIDEVDPGATAILYSAQYELDFLDADEDTKKKMTEEAPSQLEKIITNGYKGLGLEYFFTAGHDEVRVSIIAYLILMTSFMQYACNQMYAI